MKVLVRIAIGVAVLAVLAVMAYSVSKSSPPLREVPEAKVEPTAGKRAQASDDEFLGVVVAGESVDVAAQQDGLVTEVRVRLGDRVRKDDIVAVLDSGELRDQMAVVRAEWRGARSDEVKAQLKFDEARARQARWQELGAGANGAAVVSRDELEALRYQEQYAQQEQSAAAARVAEKQARIEALERLLAQTEIRAPFDGDVAQRFVSPGATVPAGQAIVRLLLADHLRVRFAVPEDQLGRMALGARVAVHASGRAEPLPGRIDKVAPEIDTASGMLIVEAALDLMAASAADVALAGRVAKVRIEAAE